MLIKQLKNRYADPPSYFKKFIIGVDRAKMKLYDVSQIAQSDVVDTGQGQEILDRFAAFKVIINRLMAYEDFRNNYPDRLFFY